MKREIATLIYWLMIIGVFATCIYVYFYLSSSGRQCVADPIQYYEKITEAKCLCANWNYFGK